MPGLASGGLALSTINYYTHYNFIAYSAIMVVLRLDPVLCGQSSRLDGLLERIVVGFCLVSVGTREACERPVSGVALAEVAGQHRGAG
jgi:hypothetical protein